MIQPLLNQQKTITKLQQLLVLFALFLLPSTVWGQITVAGYTPDADGKISGENITAGTVNFTNNTLTLTNATITGNIEWDMNNDLTIQLTGGNTINGYISSNEAVALSITDPSGSNNSYLTVGKSDNTGSAIHGFNSVTLADGLNYEEDAIYYASTKVLQNSQHVDIPLAHISYQYGLSIYKGNDVLMNFSSRKSSFSSNDNITEFSTGSISFDYSSKTLTLTGVTISDGIILWDHTGDSETLKIALSGNSTITCVTPMTITQEGETQTADIKAPIISGAEAAYWKANPTPSGRENEPYLQFTSADQNERSLILSKSGTDDCIQGFKYIDNSVVDGSVSHTKTSDNGKNSASMLISSEFYGVWVNGDPIHGTSGYAKGYKGNVTGEKNSKNEPLVTYNPTDKILTLNGATITASAYNAIESSLANLQVYLVGNQNVIRINGNDIVAFKRILTESEAKVTFTTDATSPGRLDVQGDQNKLLDGITLNYQEGLNGVRDGDTFTISAIEYGLTIGGVSVTSFNCGDIKGDNISGTVSYTPASGVLTLNNAEISGNIVSGLSSLTIHIIGNNYIGSNFSMGNITTKEELDEASLTLEKENTNSILTINYGGDGCPISGFDSFTNSDFALFGIGGESSTSLPGSFTYNNKQLEWSDENSTPTKMVACVLFEGEGTDGSPYKIQNESDLAKLATFVNQGILTNQYFKLYENITCSDNFTMDPIGTLASFSGTFDGNQKTISNLKMTTSTDISFGLFGNVNGGTIKSLTLNNCTITGCKNSGCPTGAVVGRLTSGSVTSCIVKNSTIMAKENTYNPYIGGIVGQIDGGEITQCEANAVTVTAITNYNGSGSEIAVGGIIGYGSAGTVSSCKVTGKSKITGKNTISLIYVGAVIGHLDTNMTLTENTYEYDSEVYTMAHYDNDYNKDYTGYDHRGANCNAKEITDPDGAVMYTKIATIPIFKESAGNNIGYVSIDDDNCYKRESDDNNTIYSIAPGVEVRLNIGNCVVKGSYTLNSETKSITLVKKEKDGYSYYTFTMPDADVTFTVQEAAQVSMDEDQTYGSYFNAEKDMAVPMGMTAYIVTGISEDGKKVTVTPVSYIKAGVAVLLEKGEIGEISETTDFSGSKMRYSDPSNPVTASTTSKYYILYYNKFVKVTAGTTIKKSSGGGACYLDLSSTPAGTRGFYNIGDDSNGTSGIREVKSGEVNSEKWSDAWFDLQGRRIEKPTKSGLYIRNGKKIVFSLRK